MTFGIGTACLALAACLLIPTYYVNPHVGNAYVLVAFTIVVLGGMGSAPGALVGGLLIGVVESLCGLYLGESLGQIGIFLMFILVLLLRPTRPVRGARMSNGLLRIAAGRRRCSPLVPLVVASNTVLNFLIVALMIALVGQGWNVLGGYGGQYSFGHAAFFGTGAYATAILQARYGVNAWVAFALGIAAGALVGAVIGFLTFRSGLKGSYFALVTLAFAEVLRIIASVAPITGAGVGTLIKLDLRPEALQFQSRAVFYWLLLALVAVSLLIVQAIAQSRFGAWLVAVRENEEAASALGVDTTAVKLAAMTISAAITAAGGCFYAQYFLFVDAGIAYGPWISVEALLTPIIGGVGTVFGPLLGALVVKSLGELAKLVAGDAPGLDLVIYGVVLILVVSFAPRGIAGALADARAWAVNRSARANRWQAGAMTMAEPLLAVERVSKRFGGLLALDAASLAAPAGRITGLIGPNGAGKTTLFAIISGFLRPSRGASAMAARRSPARRRIGWRGAGSPARSRSCSRLRRSRCATTSRSAPICAIARVATRWRRPSRWRARSGSPICSIAPPIASRWRPASVSSSPARWRPSRSSCCSTRFSPGSIRPKSATSFRPCAPSATAASPS